VNHVIIGIGSNIDPEKNIVRALDLLAQENRLVSTAKRRITAPIGFPKQPDFINTAALFETAFGKDAFTSRLKKIEDALGRVRTENKYGPRTIDLDIVVWNGRIVDDDYFSRDFLKKAIDELLDKYKS
jgi:2-amino-4-hydroxy-6-hydroxymethyldihydropteridine diphosphokinase